jgi:hypothetical protein
MDYSVDHLPNELLALLYRKLGLNEYLKALAFNEKLHTAWQTAVQSVTAPLHTIFEQDIRILAKYANLEKLCLHGLQGHRGHAVLGSNYFGGYVTASSRHHMSPFPAWRVFASLAPKLSQLKAIHLEGVDSAFSLLKTIAGIEDLRGRLQELRFEDIHHDLSLDDLWALQGMTALHSLNFTCDRAGDSEDGMSWTFAGPPELAATLKELSSLRDVTLHTHTAAAAGVLATFPGAITQLTSLELFTMDANHSQQTLPDAAVRQLTNLRSMVTSYPMLTASDQSAALSNLIALTSLVMHYNHFTGELPAFVMLDKLPKLVYLFLQQYSLADPFNHPALEELTTGQLLTS